MEGLQENGFPLVSSDAKKHLASRTDHIDNDLLLMMIEA